MDSTDKSELETDGGSPSTPGGPAGSDDAASASKPADNHRKDDFLKAASRWFALTFSALSGIVAGIAVIQIWSQASEFQGGGTAQRVKIDFLWFDIATTENTVVLIYVALLGALGASISSLRAAAKWATAHKPDGTRRWDRGYTSWYVVRPLIGSGLAVILYLTLVGTLLGSPAASGSLNIAGIGAIAGLAGLFSKTAFKKLEQLFKAMFSGEGPDEDVVQ